VRSAHHRLRRRGVAVIEFAMLIVIFLNFLIGALELMLMFTAWSMLQNVTDQDARQEMVLGAASATTSGAVAFAQNLAAAQGYQSSSGIAFAATTGTCATGVSQQCMTISGTYTFRFTLLTMGIGSLPLSARSVAPLS
jgi:Flp pilus assembly protein TadG